MPRWSASTARRSRGSLSEEERRYEDAHRDPKVGFRRWVAERDGQVVGFAEYDQNIRTWNASGNAGMLAISERLGFVRQPAWISLVKDFGGEGDR